MQSSREIRLAMASMSWDIKYYLHSLISMTEVMAGIPSLRALRAVSTSSRCESFRAIRMPVRMVSWRLGSSWKLKALSCSQMKPRVRMEASFTMGSWWLMLAVIF